MSDMNSFLSSLSDEQKNALLSILTSESKATDTTKAQNDPKAEKPKSTNTSESTESAHVNSDFTMKRAANSSGRREAVRAKKNQWVDEGEFKDIETNHGERSPRNRQPQKKIDVDCSVCGRSFKTDPRYVYGEYHRCSRCVGR